MPDVGVRTHTTRVLLVGVDADIEGVLPIEGDVEATLAPRPLNTPTHAAVTATSSNGNLLVAPTPPAVRKLLIVQPGHATAGIWVRLDGQAATAAPPALYVTRSSPLQFTSQVPQELITCIRDGSEDVGVSVVHLTE